MRIFIYLAMVVVLFSGCAPSIQRDISTPPAHAMHNLSEGYALLYGLMEKEQQVAGILLLKGGPDEFKVLIRDIANTSRDVRIQLEKFAEEDAAISLEGASLPLIEAETRASIESEKTRQLLGSNGREFQTRLIVEQLKATNYAAHLARSLDEQESSQDRKAQLEVIVTRFDELTGRLFNLLQSMGSQD